MTAKMKVVAAIATWGNETMAEITIKARFKDTTFRVSEDFAIRVMDYVDERQKEGMTLPRR